MSNSNNIVFIQKKSRPKQQLLTKTNLVKDPTAQKNLRESMHFIDKSDTPAEQFADDSRAGISPAKSEILLSQELF